MTNMMRAAVFWMFLNALTSCAHGPQVSVCVTDFASDSYLCVDQEDKEYSVPFEKGTDFLCMLPQDLETMLVACKKDHVILEVPLCQISDNEIGCKYGSNRSDVTGNLICFSPKDRRRILERCEP